MTGVVEKLLDLMMMMIMTQMGWPIGQFLRILVIKMVAMKEFGTDFFAALNLS